MQSLSVVLNMIRENLMNIHTGRWFRILSVCPLTFFLCQPVLALTLRPRMRQEVLSATSSDGIRWSIEEGIRIPCGKKYDRMMATVPDAVPLPSGVRIYYVGDNEDYHSRILSAFSEDGLNFRKEGLRLQHRLHAVRDPEVLKTPDGYAMLSVIEEKLWVATSKDGLEWKLQRQIEGITRAVDPAVLKLASEYIMLFSSPRIIRVAKSRDLLRWQIIGPTTLRGGSVSLIKNDNLFYLYFTAGSIDPFALDCSIARATSPDALNWKFDRIVLRSTESGIGYCNPDVIRTKTGFRMYFNKLWYER